MIQSIQASNTSLYNPVKNNLVTGKITTDNTEATKKEQEDENTTTSSQGDTVTISNAAMQASKTFTGESANRPSVNGTSEDSYTDATAAAIASAASDAGINDATAVKNENAANASAVSGSSSSSDDSSLSQYSEAELKQMLQDGEITRAEYNAEIKSREESEAAEDDDSDKSVNETDETEA